MLQVNNDLVTKVTGYGLDDIGSVPSINVKNALTLAMKSS